MRGFSKIGVVSALIGAMLVTTASVNAGQNLKEADALKKKKVTELDKSVSTARAVPFLMD